MCVCLRGAYADCLVSTKIRLFKIMVKKTKFCLRGAGQTTALQLRSKKNIWNSVHPQYDSATRTYCRLSSGMFVLSTVQFNIDENKHNKVNMARPTHPDPGRFERGGWGGFRIHIDVDTHLVGIIPHYTQPQPSQTLCAPPTTWD